MEITKTFKEVIGSKVTRVDAVPKVNGVAKYAADMSLKGMVHCSLVIARKPSGILRGLDIAAAVSIPGVVGVYTSDDVPGKNQLGEVIKDMPCFVEPGGRIRFYGDVVAIVAASSKEIAEKAAEKVTVDIEELPAVFTIDEAMEDIIKVHESTNVAVKKRIRKGDIVRGFEESSIIVEDEFYAHYQEQAYLETQGVTVIPDTDYGYTIYATMQCPYYVQGSVSHVLGIPLNKVRAIQTETGGAFGGKEDVPSFVAAYAAVAAYNCKRPAQLIYSREIDIQTTSKRHPVKSRYKIGVDRSGRIKAMEISAYMDMGAYSTLSPIVMFRTLVHAAGSYDVENVSVDTYGVYTNKVPPGAFRGFGSPQVLFAVESMIDEIAIKLRLDPIEFRLLNTLRVGSRTSTGQLLSESVGAAETLENVRKISGWTGLKKEVEEFNSNHKDFKRGLGVSHIIYGVSLGAGGQHLDASGAHLQINRDGTVDVRIGGTEMGQGAKTVIAMITAEELGQQLAAINVHQPDTAFVPDSGPTVASRTTLYTGNAVKLAAGELKRRLINVLATSLDIEPDDIEVRNGYFHCPGGESITFEDVTDQAFVKNIKLVETGWYETPRLRWDPDTGMGDAYITYSFGSQVVLVEVDMATGLTRVLKAYTSHDVGKALNPEGVVGQIQGGFIQGMGYGLYENLKHDNGRINTDNFNTYIIPTIHEIPAELKIDIVEDGYSRGPYGAKGIGEPSLMPAPASIANAVSAAIDRRVHKIPVTPEYTLRLVKEAAR